MPIGTHQITLTKLDIKKSKRHCATQFWHCNGPGVGLSYLLLYVRLSH
jgi:hypothetical protein